MVSFYDTRIGRYVRQWKYGRVFNRLKPGEVAIDCGANIGKITRAMASSGALVYAFEPDPNAFRILVENTKGLSNVICHNKAVSTENGIAKIYFNDQYCENPEKWSTGSTLLPDKPHVDKSNFAVCETLDLAEFIKNLNKPIGVLKMDIEGAEVNVLNKLIDLGLTQRIRRILVETHERFPTLKEPIERLRARIVALNLRNIDLDWA